MDWRDQAPAGKSGGEAREGSPRQMASDYQLFRLAEAQIEARRGTASTSGQNNREWREQHRRTLQLADEIVAKILGIREAGALLDGLDRRDAPQPTRPENSTIRTGWVRPIQFSVEDLWNPASAQHPVGTSKIDDLALRVFNAKMDLIKAAVAQDSVIVSDPEVTTTFGVRAMARTVPAAMYVADKGKSGPGYGSYLPEHLNEIHWYEEPGQARGRVEHRTGYGDELQRRHGGNL